MHSNISLNALNGLSIDFGGTKILAARVANGQIIQQFQVETQGDAPITQQISEIINLLNQLQVSNQDQIAIAVAGRITAQGQWQAVNNKTLSTVNRVPIKQLLEQQLNREIPVKNDALAALLGESYFGAALNYARAAYITVSTGVGGAIILEGIPVTSENGIAGHIGFISSSYADRRCGSGRMNTVESVASGRAMTAIAQEAGYDVIDAKQIYNQHLNGAAWATKIIHLSAKAIAQLCANLQSIFGLDVIVIGGGVGLATGYIALVQQYLNAEPDIFQVKLSPAKLAQNSAIFGNLVK